MLKIAVGSDERTHVSDAVIADLRQRGHELTFYGPLNDQPESWSRVAQQVAEAVANGVADEGILFCWTGTGVSIAANKVPGIRAALCEDAETAAGARKWNNANNQLVDYCLAVKGSYRQTAGAQTITASRTGAY